MHPNALKCIFSKKGKQIQKMVTNDKKWPKIANNCKISEITKYGEKMRTNCKNSQKCIKNAQNEPKTAKFKKTKKCHHFSGSKLPQKFIQWTERAKNGFKCFKMHSNTYSPKRAKKCKKKCNKNVRKLQIISKFQKLLNMVKKLHKLPKM